MTAFLPRTARGFAAEPDHPRLRQRPYSPAEQRARWEVRAAQWRARELAVAIFGEVSDGALLGLRAAGDLRGLLHLSVPFDDLEAHRELEVRFLAAADADPILSRVPLVYVFEPDPV